MIKKIITSFFLCSFSFAFQNLSFSLIANSQTDVPKIYQSKNQLPQSFDSEIISNLKFEKLNKKKNLSFVGSLYFNNQKAEVYELGLRYSFKSHDILIGMIDEKNYEFLGLNEHIVFGNNHKPLKKITIKSNTAISLPFVNNLPFFNKISFTYDFSNALLDKNYKYLWDDFYWQEAKEIYYSKEPRLHYKKLNFKYQINELTNFQLSLNHAAIWGGTVINETNNVIKKYSNDIINLHKVIFWQGGRSEYDRNDVIGGVIGNHLGSIDFSLTHDNIKYYYQHIFEDGGSFWFDNTIDGLWGVRAISKNNSSLFKEISFEFLNTKYQSGKIHPDGVDSYFWHDQYPAGWQYEGQSMGSLFITPNQNRSQIVFLSSRLYLNENSTIKIHAGYGKIFHYYGYKGWDINVEQFFTDNYSGKYSSILLSLKSFNKNNIQVEYNLAFEKDIDIKYEDNLEKVISYKNSVFLNINLIKELSL